MNVPLSRPWLGEEEINAVTEVLRSDRLALGPVNQAFEEAFAEMCDTKHAVSVNSGTSGLHLAIRALEIGPGDEVISTPFSFIASTNCILYEGGTPVLVDVDEKTFNIDPARIEAAITEKTKAIIPVHVFGQPAEMDPIMELAEKYNLAVIEDACESIAAKYKGRTAGSIGDCSVFGFYPNKQMTTGEGGMICTNDDRLADLFRSLRNQGRGDSLQWLTHVRLGYNYRISEMTAAIGLEQVKKLPQILDTRRIVAKKYIDGLKHREDLILPYMQDHTEHSWFVFPVRVRAEIRDKMIEGLMARGIQSKAYFDPCIHLQDFYMKEFGFKKGDFPIAESLSNTIIILPFYSLMTDEEIEYVLENFLELIDSFS